ncbi:hypothetical protein PR002_g24381 [Phytophthora rubi]|uniref:Uncharacterized protein n=1 Tax=Phytophthora rubi TaxID=129364 RepID=A0A6A3IC79_9STRA|nr:hypothetical protein PR002_g24381 [Phytophthora rubi]
MEERSVDAGKLPEAEGEDKDEDVEDDKNALGLGMAKGALSVAKKTEYDCDDAETSEVRSKEDWGSKEMAAATEADASEREDTAETEAHRHGTVVDHHLSHGPVDRVRVTIPGRPLVRLLTIAHPCCTDARACRRAVRVNGGKVCGVRVQTSYGGRWRCGWRQGADRSGCGQQQPHQRIDVRSADGGAEGRDEERGRVLRVEVQWRASDETKQREADQLLHKRRKRLEHAKTRQKRCAERERLAAELAKSGAATMVEPTRAGASSVEAARLEKDVATDANVAMPEPNEAFRSALDWSARAAQALYEVQGRQLELRDAFTTLAVAESRRQEALAAGNVVGGAKMREGVAQQLRSKTRRRFEKRVRKAKVKERCELQAALAELTHPALAYKAAEEVYRRYGAEARRVLSREEAEAIGFTLPNATKVLRQRSRRQQDDTRMYVYHCGSVYAGARVESSGDRGQPRRVDQLRAVQAPIVDSLPTAVMRVHGERRRIKLDTGAQYSVAGEWRQYDEKQHVLPPVDYVDGFTGAASRVLGVWRFKFRTQYEQTMEVDALIVEGATDEFLLGESWMMKKGIKIDFVSCDTRTTRRRSCRPSVWRATRDQGVP